jgi:hypothetical protein
MPLEYDDIPRLSVVRYADNRNDDCGVVEDGDPGMGILDVRWCSWQDDTRPEEPADLVIADGAWLASHGYTVKRAI